MNTYTIEEDFEVYGKEVPTFPAGIPEAFDKLIATLPEGTGRPCFGLSKMKEDGTILYIATIEKHQENEGRKNNYNTYTIEKGDYLCEEITDWMSKIEMIKNNFDQILKQPEALPGAWCIEWYQSDKKMMCLVKIK